MAHRRLSLMALFALAANGFMIPSTISLPEINSEKLTDIMNSISSTLGKSGAEDTALDAIPSYSDRIISENSDVHIAPIPSSASFPLDQPLWMLSDLNINPSMMIECKGCPVPPFKKSGTSLLIMDFAIDSSGSELLLNGKTLYPLPENKMPDLQGFQISDAGLRHADSWFEDRDLVYEAGLSVSPWNKDGDQLIDIWLHVTGLDGMAVELLPVNVKLVQTTKEISIHDLVFNAAEMPTLPATHSPFGTVGPCHGPALFCHLFSFFETKMSAWRSKLHRLRPCPGAHRAGAFSTNGEEGQSHFRQHGHHGSHGHHGNDGHHMHGHHAHHMHHHRLHHLAMAINNFIVGFAVPVMIGILAGLTASLVGMVVGTSVAWLWIRFVRKGKRGPHGAVDLHDREGSSGDEAKVGLLEDESPEYEHPPVYVEKE